MNRKWFLPVLAVMLLTASIAQSPRNARATRSPVAPNAAGCWVAQCYIDGWTLHWQQSYSTYREAEAARADHDRNNSDRHQTIVDTCE